MRKIKAIFRARGSRQNETSIVHKWSVAEYFSVLIACALFFEPVSKALLSGIRFIIKVPFHLDLIFLYVAVAIIAIRVIPQIVKSFPWEESSAFALLMAFILISYVATCRDSLVSSVYEQIIFDLMQGFFVFYFLFRFSISKNHFLSIIGPVSVVSTIAMTFNLFFVSNFSELSYSQYYGYLSLVSFVVSAACFFQIGESRRKILYCVSMFTGLILLFASGARGPFVVALVYLAIKMLSSGERVSLKRAVVTAIVAVFGIFILVNGNFILYALSDLLGQFGGSGRFLAKISQTGSLFTSVGRDSLYPTVVGLISESPIFGYGIGNDRVEIASSLGSTNIFGYYPHNIFLEIILQFGIPLGTILLVALVILLIRAFRLVQGFEREWLLIFVTLGFMPLLFSSSYLDSPLFFALLAAAVNVFRKREIHE